MKIVVIIPTYNEAGMISILLEKLQDIFARLPQHDWNIVVVDANSPDGTADIVRQKSETYGNIHLLVEPKKQGIAMAYITGMRYAIDILEADAFVEFDGDGQHNPDDIPRLVEELGRGYDHVIGSRYVDGGSVPKEWVLYRKLLSRLGSLYARLLLELPVYDATSGLKATRIAGPAQALPLTKESLLSNHYAYKLQFLHAMTRAGARIQEIPIEFRIREHDISKSAWYDILESLRVTGILRLQTLKEWRLLRVVGVSAVGLLVQATAFEIMGIRLHIFSPSSVILIVGEFCIIMNFLMHERFSFKDKKEESDPFYKKIIRFHLLSLGSVIIQWILVRSVESLIGESPMYLRLAYITGVLLGFALIYIGSYFWVWSKKNRSSIL